MIYRLSAADEEILVGGKSGGPAIQISGGSAPSPLASWWPLILLAGVGAVVWWLVRGDKEVGRGLRPLAG